jgi:hypothetical protein
MLSPSFVFVMLLIHFIEAKQFILRIFMNSFLNVCFNEMDEMIP